MPLTECPSPCHSCHRLGGVPTPATGHAGRAGRTEGLMPRTRSPGSQHAGEAFLTQGGGHLGCISEDLLGPGGVGACTLTSWPAQGQCARPCPSGLDKETSKEGMVGKSDSDFFRGE